MQRLGGAIERRGGHWVLLIALLAVCLALPGPKPAQASGDDVFWAGIGVMSLLGATAIGYTVYELSRPDQPRLLDGEFYGGAYLGAALAPDQDLHYNNGAIFNNGRTTFLAPKFKVLNNQFDPGIFGGIKLGYFFKGCPYLGLEGDSGFGSTNVSRQVRSLNPAILGSPVVAIGSTSWYNWITALHIVGRYGFLKDGEVPFGRLQPYVGIGPAVDVIYDPNDSAKNFAIDVMGGLRYMFCKNFSAFVEYKYNHQFSPELESHQVQVGNFNGLGTATFDYDLHRVVVGMNYHW